MDGWKRDTAGLFVPQCWEPDRRYCSLVGLDDGMFGAIPLPIPHIAILSWGAGGGSRPGRGLGGAGAFASYSGYLPYGTILTLIVGAPGENGPNDPATHDGAGAGGGFSGVFEGTVLSQSSALVVAGAGGGGAGGWPSGWAGGTAKATGWRYNGGPLQGGSSLDGARTARGGSPGGGDGYGFSGRRSTGGGGGGFEGGASGLIDMIDGEITMGSAGGYGGSCYTRSGLIMPGDGTTPGNASAPERGTSGNPEVAGKVIIYVNGQILMALSIPQTKIITITRA